MQQSDDAAEDRVEVDSRTVACDGLNVALGHPRVFLRIEPDSDGVRCPYCSRLFVLAPGAGGESH